MKLSFLGAAGNVTGSSYLVECAGLRLLVDCGMYQERDLRARNWDPFPAPPSSIDAVLLTHAHLDHCGLLPKLVREGFEGPIYCTAATADIAGIVMLDSAKIQEEDVEYKRKRHEREGRTGPYPLAPLYTIADAEAAVGCLKPVAFDAPLALADGLVATFHGAGHILGAAMILLAERHDGGDRTVLFSGDIGRWHAPILKDPTVFEAADYVVCESTYGDRVHESTAHIPGALADVINAARAKGGKILIPSFAVERTQDLLFHLGGLLAEGRIPALPVFVDSPMAIKVTEVFRKNLDLFDETTARMLAEGRHPCDFPGLTMTRTVAESKAINDVETSAVVIAGSGMCTGGRIKHHLVHHVEDPNSTLLFIGYQAVGTLGRILLEGADPVRILGREWSVKLRIETINGFSGHADREEILLWLTGLRQAPKRIFLTHGEPRAAKALAAAVTENLGWDVTVPDYRDTVELA